MQDLPKPVEGLEWEKGKKREDEMEIERKIDKEKEQKVLSPPSPLPSTCDALSTPKPISDPAPALQRQEQLVHAIRHPPALYLLRRPRVPEPKNVRSSTRAGVPGELDARAFTLA